MADSCIHPSDLTRQDQLWNLLTNERNHIYNKHYHPSGKYHTSSRKEYKLIQENGMIDFFSSKEELRKYLHISKINVNNLIQNKEIVIKNNKHSSYYRLEETTRTIEVGDDWRY